MDRNEFEAWEMRVRARAEQLWRAAGRPDGGSRTYLAEARELISIEEVRPPTRDPDEAARPVIEEAAIQSNLGEFPTLTDQGEEQVFPSPIRPDDGPRLSDEDASADGGVLPENDEPAVDLPEVSVADADVTSSPVNGWDGPPNDDLNDDGVPDPFDLDEDDEDAGGADADGEMPPGDEYEDSAPPRDDQL